MAMIDANACFHLRCVPIQRKNSIMDIPLQHSPRPVGLSDDEIRNQIDTRLPYRIGWPTLPVLPVYNDVAKADFPDQDKHTKSIAAILKQQGFGDIAISVVHRVPRGREPDSNKATLLVVTNPGTENRLEAVLEMRKHLAAHNIDIGIEITDVRAERPSTFALLRSDTPIVDRWDGGLQTQVVGIIKESGLAMTSVSVYRRGIGKEAEGCPPTVLITASDASANLWWDVVLPQLREVCSPDLEVELYFQKNILLSSRKLNLEDFSSSMPMGASCGPAGNDISGTMGGMIQLRKGNKDLGCFGLSNHHVMETEELTKATKENTTLKPTDPLVREAKLIVNSPSDCDKEAHVEKLRSGLKSLQKLAKKYGADQGCHNDGQREKLNRINQRIEKREMEIDQIELSNRTAGSIFASSGYRTNSSDNNPGLALDWSLTKLASTRQMEETLPEEATEEAIENPEVYVAGGYEKWVYRKAGKFGRTTGWTTGTINPIKTYIEQSRCDPFLAWPLVGNRDHPISKVGDSGSLVLDIEPDSSTNGAWLGLLFAGSIEGVAVSALFVPIDVILKDIETVTGCTVVEPVPISPSE